MIFISNNISLNDSEVDISAIRAQGAGGQNVNKVSSAIHLRFDIPASSLSDVIKQRLLDSKDSRITKEGVLIIKAQQFRTQERNRIDALERLQSFIIQATHVNKALQPLQGINSITFLSTKLLHLNNKHAFFGDSTVFTIQ